MRRAVQSNLAVLSSCPKMDHSPGEYGPFLGTTQIPVFIRDSNDATNCCAQNNEIFDCFLVKNFRTKIEICKKISQMTECVRCYVK